MKEIPPEVRERLDVLRTLLMPSGLFLASEQGVPTGYDKAWLRDNFYTALAFEWAGEMDVVRNVYRAILDIFLKHEGKIDWAAQNRPHATWQYIHARYHPETFDEYWEEWGNKQNDAVGAILYKLGDLEAQDRGVIASDDNKRIVQRLVDYLASIEYWHDPDNGIWEESEEIHASSIGACVAGLKKISALPYITIPDGLIAKGEETLKKILPRESANKFSDLALLSLIFPYDVISKEAAKEILETLEYNLVKKRGVIRFKTDKYYNKNIDGWSEEAEWTFGFPWLAIIYHRLGEELKAREYLEKTKMLLHDNKLPELYYSNSNKPNDNIPLGWSESLYAVAMMEIGG
ncbi:glycoside hydrolase family 15 protein [bacterium]|nr:glycoside hydrolase family 15 protein [bacterium]